VAYAPDGQSVACGSGFSEEIHTFFVADGAPLAVYDTETGWGPSPSLPMRYSPDGRLAYGRSDPTVVMADCPGEIRSYGAGCAGSGGLVPSLQGSGCAARGSLLELRIAQALGGAPALLAFGTAKASTPLLGCEVLVAPLPPLGVPLALSGLGAGAGSAALPLLLGPATPRVTVTVQALVLDPGGPFGISASQGLQLDIE
jgi:hypothetical protein